MKKYWFIYSLYWQEGLQRRASFLMERFRSLVVLLSFYYLWSALLSHSSSFAGYDRSQMITYVFGVNILRSLVFAGRTDEVAWEINHGQLSSYLLKPMNYIAYTFSRDLSEKSINLMSAIVEIFLLTKIFGITMRWPHAPVTWLFLVLAVANAVLINFLLSFMVGCWGFWTAESGGPRFCLELFLEFSAGAFFPLDVLPASFQAILRGLPSPYLVFFPLRIFLEKTQGASLMNGFLVQIFWMVMLWGLVRVVWQKGVRVYVAQGG